jgi:hypothetical protein
MIQVAPIRAVLFGSDRCHTEGITTHGITPVLAMWAALFSAGLNPARPLHCYRGDTFCLIVRSIAIGAQLRVRGNGVGFEIIATATRPTAPPVHATAFAGVAMTAIRVPPIQRSSRKGTREGAAAVAVAPGQFPGQAHRAPWPGNRLNVRETMKVK